MVSKLTVQTVHNLGERLKYKYKWLEEFYSDSTKTFLLYTTAQTWQYNIQSENKNSAFPVQCIWGWPTD